MSLRLIPVIAALMLASACSGSQNAAPAASGDKSATNPITGAATLTATPATIRACDARDGNARATVSWDAPGIASTSIHVGTPTGTVFTEGATKGSAATGEWVRQETLFFLVNPADNSVLARLQIPFVDC